MIEETELIALVMASCQSVSHLELDEAIERIIHEAAGVVRAESCSVILRHETFNECYFYAATGPHSHQLHKTRFKDDLGFAGQVLRTGEAALVPDAQTDKRHYGGVDEATGVQTRSMISVPLKSEGKVIGVLEAVNSLGRDRFADRDMQMLTLFANFAGAAIQNAREFGRTRMECQAFQSAAERGNVFMGNCPAMQKVWDTAGRAAAAKCTVLLTGESGTGKEVVALYIHRTSPRRDKPFICVNCAAIDENLLNSELFGHEKGAFTGATDRRIGRFEMADSGTLFLDEISECSSTTQARLLRVLQEQAFERLGGNETIRTDARIIVATNADMQTRIAEGTFREDLFHRLNVVSIQVPPLRERSEDIPELVRHFVTTFSTDLNRQPVEFDDAAMRALQRYEWPGNVREVRNFVERLMVLHRGGSVNLEGLTDYLPLAAQGEREEPEAPAGQPEQAAGSLWGAEKQMIEKALVENNWNQSQAARSLGITRHHLRYRMKKFGISKD